MRKDREYLAAEKPDGQESTMLTWCDYPTAILEDKVGIDAIFAGDSVGTNILGYDGEREVTTGDMIHHLNALRRGAARCRWLVQIF